MTWRSRVDAVLLPARMEAFAPGQFIGQESFTTADGIDRLVRAAGITAGEHVLDLCCGLGGPGRRIIAATGCRYLGVDGDEEAVSVARTRSAGLPAEYLHATVPPLPPSLFDVVVLLETLLAFPDKPALLRAVAESLEAGGRFAFTVEEGRGPDAAERAAMPNAGTVWPVPLSDLLGLLAQAGLRVDSCVEETAAQLEVVTGLIRAFSDHAPRLREELGVAFVDDLLTSHRLWRDWMTSRRIRKFSVVARKN